SAPRRLGELLRGGDSPRREHAHATARAQLLPVERAHVGPQGARGFHGRRARAALRERGPAPLLRQRDLSRPGRRTRDPWLRAREPLLLRQAARRARAGGARAPRRAGAWTDVLRPAPASGARARTA